MGGTNSFWGYLPFLLGGVPTTLELTFLAMILAVVVSLALALARSSNFVPLRWVGGFIVEVFRGSSALVQLFWVFYVLPFFGINFPPMVVGVLVLGLNEGAYFSEVVRAGLNAVGKGQREATIALHLPIRYRFFHIILPQALPIMIPPFGNALVAMLKFTALVSVVSIQDLSFRAGMIRTSTGQSAPIYSVTLIIYFILALLLAGLVMVIERSVNKRAGRAVRPWLGRGHSSVPAWALGGRS